MSNLRRDIQRAINRNSAENGSNTPDFILGEYLVDCLEAYDRAVTAREKWYGRTPKPVSAPILLGGPSVLGSEKILRDLEAQQTLIT